MLAVRSLDYGCAFAGDDAPLEIIILTVRGFFDTLNGAGVVLHRFVDDLLLVGLARQGDKRTASFPLLPYFIAEF